MTKDFVRVVENVEVLNFPALAIPNFFESFLDRICRTPVPRASRCRKEENLLSISYGRVGFAGEVVGLAGAGVVLAGAGADPAGCVRLYSLMNSCVMSRVGAA